MADGPARRLIDLLAAREGLVCTVGAGGKKTTLYRLAEAHLECGTRRVGLTCTVTMALPPARLADAPLVAEPDVLARTVTQAAREARLLAFAQPSPKAGRVGGLPTDLVAALHGDSGFTLTLIKADGARMRWIKAPADGEPVLPPGPATVLPVVSAKVFDRPLDETVAHRPERVATVTGAEPGAPLRPVHVARLLASSDGALRGVGRATVVPIINMVEDAPRLDAARQAARLALRLSDRFERVVLTSMTLPDPVVEVVRR